MILPESISFSGGDFKIYYAFFWLYCRGIPEKHIMAIKTGTSGNDTLNGSAGWDTLYGVDGNDTLDGGTGSDVLSGGYGNDVLIGGVGFDSLNGGGGNDTFRYASASDAAGDHITDFAAGDRIDLSAIPGHTFIGNAQFNGVKGEIRYITSSAIQIDSNGDALPDAQLYVIGSANFAETTAGSGILVAANGTALSGDDSSETMAGSAGNDTISGNGGDDSLNGKDGNDKLSGGDGNDLLSGGRGFDTLSGGAGNDTFLFSHPDEFRNEIQAFNIVTDDITDFSGGDQIVLAIPGLTYIGDLPFSGVPGEYRVGRDGLEFDSDGDKLGNQTIDYHSSLMLRETAKGSNQLVAASNKQLSGTDANDSLAGGNGHDSLSGLGGDDVLNGGMGRDTLYGGGGNDTLYGQSGMDSLGGGDGDDILVGGLDADTLTGGAGNDRFVFTSQDDAAADYPHDYITDFTDGDIIDLSGVDADTSKPGDQAFVFIGTEHFSGTAGELFYSGGTLYCDTQGDGNADMFISLYGGPGWWNPGLNITEAIFVL
jgi:Ca2+-binding RTX toxin-like protein